MERWPEARPGEFKLQPNFAGTTEFVAPAMVRGTLIEGSTLALSVPERLARAICYAPERNGRCFHPSFPHGRIPLADTMHRMSMRIPFCEEVSALSFRTTRAACMWKRETLNIAARSDVALRNSLQEAC